MQNYVYDANFTGNLLIVGRTGCGKTYFTQKLAVNDFVGKLNEVEWVLYFNLNKEREAKTESCFSCDVGFQYLISIEKFDDLLEVFKACLKTAEKNDGDDDDTSLPGDGFFNESDNFGEKTTHDRLILMDNLSGLTKQSKKFASFLTVPRKSSYICVYIFPIIFSEKLI